MNEKKQHIRRNDFLHFGETIGLPRNSAEKMIEKVSNCEERYLDMCQTSYLPDEMKEQVKNLIRERMSVLK